MNEALYPALDAAGITIEVRTRLHQSLTMFATAHAHAMQEAGFVAPREEVLACRELVGSEQRRRQTQAMVVLSELALVHSELSEAAEAARKQHPSSWDDTETPDTLVREYAGAMLRLFDSAHRLGFSHKLALALFEEFEHNAQRQPMHGGNAA